MKQTYLAPETEVMELQTANTVLQLSVTTTMALLQSHMSAEDATLYNSGTEVDW